MKKLIFTFLIMATPFLAQAQKRPGTVTIYPRIGVNWSRFTGDKMYIADMEDSEYDFDAKYRTGFTAGAEVQYQFNSNVAASIGALYSKQGTDYNHIPDDFGKTSVRTDNLLVPVLFVETTPVGVSIKVGVQAEFLLDSNIYNDFMKKVNLSIPVGLSYEWHNIAIDARYNIGVTKVYKNYFFPDAKSSSFLLTLGYGIDL